MADLIWPARPLCHDGNRYLHEPSWRPPRERRNEEDPYEETFRTCSYCGSMHPEDLYLMMLTHERIARREFNPGSALAEHGVEGYQRALAAHYKVERGIFRVGGSDWKYGWPHKFYIEGIPNAAAGSEYRTYTYGGGDPEKKPEGDGWEWMKTSVFPDGGWRKLYSTAPCPPFHQGKWYNEHLLDLVPETFDAFTEQLYRHTGIRFTVDDGGKLHYVAPGYGYQP